MHLLTANKSGEKFFRSALAMLEESQREDRFGKHQLVADPASADVILFAENNGAGPYQELCRRHPVAHRFPQKCLVFDVVDNPIPFMRGIYPSLEKKYHDPRRTRSGVYPTGEENPYLEKPDGDVIAKYLFSFIGAAKNFPIRRDVLKLVHPRAFLLDVANSLEIKMHGDISTKEEFWKSYARVMRQSLFVICPRGVGAGSIRLFETMRIGRVPVIVSDSWVAPDGPDWTKFSLQVPEAEIASIPKLLESLEVNVLQMGRAARTAWEDWFSPATTFHRMTEDCLKLLAGPADTLAVRLSLHAQLLRPFHRRQLLRPWRRKIRQG